MMRFLKLSGLLLLTGCRIQEPGDLPAVVVSEPAPPTYTGVGQCVLIGAGTVEFREPLKIETVEREGRKSE